MCPIVARLAARSSTTVAGLPLGLTPHAVEDLTPFRRHLTEYFVLEQGRGRLCHIDTVARGHRLLLFVYLDDYPAVSVGFDAADRLERRPHRPTFEVVYQFDHAAGTLSVFAKGDSRCGSPCSTCSAGSSSGSSGRRGWPCDRGTGWTIC